MQTFLPTNNIEEVAKILDNKRLNKQKVEAYQILNTLSGKSKGWKNHPAVLMWKGYEGSLVEYALIIAKECLDRGFKDTLIPKFKEYEILYSNKTKPPWFGNKEFHDSHKSNLIRKNHEHYNRFWQNIEPNIEYSWPIRKEQLWE
jgi:hypothetical protein